MLSQQRPLPTPQASLATAWQQPPERRQAHEGRAASRPSESTVWASRGPGRPSTDTRQAAQAAPSRRHRRARTSARPC
eukprot:4817633-Pyramimonas_sp.AAC.1